MIALDGSGQHAHSFCGHPVGSGSKGIYMIFQDIPGNGIRLAAGKAGHDGFHISVHNPDISVCGAGSFIKAGSSVRFYDDYLGRIVRITVGEISLNRSGKRADSGLDKYMSGTLASVFMKLFVRFHCHCSVTLHDPGGDFLISVPCGILHHNAVFRFFCHGVCHADAFVIVIFFNRCLSAFGKDIVQSCLCASLRHEHDSFLSEFICRPRDTPAVIAVRCREESSLSELFAEFF